VIQGRVNKETGNFEVLRSNKWVELDEKIWVSVKTKIATNFLIALCYDADNVFKEKAPLELSRRIKCELDLKMLWAIGLNARRWVGDLAFNEIFERSSRLLLPHYENK
jgi:hypothetical protein